MGVQRLWVKYPATDLVLGLLAIWWLAAPEPMIAKVVAAEVLVPLIGAVAAVLAILAAVVTFSCSTLYQSHALKIQEGRLLFGHQLRAIWRGCILAAVGCSVLSLSAFVLLVWSERLTLVVLTACVIVATARTVRAVYWLDRVIAAEDRDLAGFDFTLRGNKTSV